MSNFEQIRFGLQMLLNHQGMNQADLARALGVERQQVNNWMSGEVNFKIDSLIRMLEGMKADLTSLGTACSMWNRLDAEARQRVLEGEIDNTASIQLAVLLCLEEVYRALAKLGHQIRLLIAPRISKR